MFKRNTFPVWVGILVLSGVFLMGQETWEPPPCTDADGDGFGAVATPYCQYPFWDCDDDNADINISDELSKLREKSDRLTEKIFSSLSTWQVVQVARHPKRPYTLDYIAALFTDFEELHGDRQFADGCAGMR